MYTNLQWRNALSKILELTSKGEIVWSQHSPLTDDVWTETDRTYIAEYKGSVYGVSQVRRKHYFDEEDWAWTSDYVLNFYERTLEGELKRIASAPESNIIQNIFSLAQDSYAAKRNVLGDLLGD